MKHDEYNWSTYHNAYAAQVAHVLKKRTLSFGHNDFEIIEGEIHMKKGLLPLHPNHKLLYETIIDLSPVDVHEVGCGWGNSLANINLLTGGQVAVYGSEISQEQINALLLKYSWLKKQVALNDIVSHSVKPRDIVFTTAVLMHLGDSNLDSAIRNIAASTKQHIIMIENPRRHYPSIFFRIGPEGWEDAKVKEIKRGEGQLALISK